MPAATAYIKDSDGDDISIMVTVFGNLWIDSVSLDRTGSARLWPLVKRHAETGTIEDHGNRQPFETIVIATSGAQS